MKKIVYLAPVLLLGLVGNGAMADQNTHISRLDTGFMTSFNESQPDQMELDSWRKVHVINSDNQNNLTNKSVKFKVGYTLDLVSLAKTANFNSSKALSDPND